MRKNHPRHLIWRHCLASLDLNPLTFIIVFHQRGNLLLLHHPFAVYAIAANRVILLTVESNIIIRCNAHSFLIARNILARNGLRLNEVSSS